MEPLPRGAGFEFVDKIFGGSIPQNFRPAVEKGIRESAERGWLSGNPVVDFRVTLTDGSYHDVDSSEMAFKIAGSLAFKAAMEQARPTILEPIYSVEITAPEEYMGDIMGDLSSRRGKPQGMETQGHSQIIKAIVPLSELLTYASTLEVDHLGSRHLPHGVRPLRRAAGAGAGEDRRRVRATPAARGGEVGSYVTRDWVYINELADHVGTTVLLKGWVLPEAIVREDPLPRDPRRHRDTCSASPA